MLPTLAALETRTAELSFLLTQVPVVANVPVLTVPNEQFTGLLEGILTDRSGAAIPNLRISIKNGPQTKTDAQGIFILENVPTGHQLILVQATMGGEFSQNIYVEEGQKTYHLKN